MTRDSSDWDPLPTDQTGLHPGEAQKFLGGPKPQPEAQQFVVVRAAAPGAAFAGGAVAAKEPKPPTQHLVRSTPKPAVSVSREQPAMHDMLPALQRQPGLPMPPSLLGPQPGLPSSGAQDPAHECRREPKPEGKRESMAESKSSSRPESKPESKPLQRAEARVETKALSNAPSANLPSPSAVMPAPAFAGQDPRQQQTWFQAMPVVEQMRLLRAWRHESDALAVVAADAGSRRQRLLERFWVAYVVFFVAALPLMLTEGLMGFVRMAMAGCVTGLLWQVVPHTRAFCSWSAVGAYSAVSVLPRLAELVADPFLAVSSIGGATLVYWLAGLGAAHEQPGSVADAAAED